MEYYHDLVTQRSWEELTQLKKVVDFVLIGGWAIYFYTQGLKSKDIDIVVSFDALKKLSDNYDFVKNERLCKYEAVKDVVQIDIYLPHYSKLGIPVEDLLQNTTDLEGFTLVDVHYLFVLKLYTLLQRGRNAKGRKDFVDLIALVRTTSLDWDRINELCRKYNIGASVDNFKLFLKENLNIQELDINTHVFSKLKKTIGL